MVMKKILLAAVMAGLLGACSSTTAQKPTQAYNGYFDNYPQMQQVTAEDGEPVLRWVSPNLASFSVGDIIIDSIQFADNKDIPSNFSDELLAELKQALRNKLIEQVSKVVPVTEQAGNNTIKLKLALTGIKMENEALSPLEFIPLRAVMSSIEAAAGGRDQDVHLYIESQLVNAKTGETLFASVRHGEADQLASKTRQAELDDFEDLIEDWSEFAANGLSQLVKAQ